MVKKIVPPKLSINISPDLRKKMDKAIGQTWGGVSEWTRKAIERELSGRETSELEIVEKLIEQAKANKIEILPYERYENLMRMIIHTVNYSTMLRVLRDGHREQGEINEYTIWIDNELQNVERDLKKLFIEAGLLNEGASTMDLQNFIFEFSVAKIDDDGKLEEPLRGPVGPRLR